MSYTPIIDFQSTRYCDMIEFTWTADAGDSIYITQRDVLTGVEYNVAVLAGGTTSYSTNQYYYDGTLHTMYPTNQPIEYNVTNSIGGQSYISQWASMYRTDYPRITNFVITGTTTDTSISFKWDNHQDDGLCNDYIYEYKIDAYAPDILPPTWIRKYWRSDGADDFPFSANTYTLTGLTPDTRYNISIYYTPISDVDGGGSPPPVTTTTLPIIPIPPIAPTNLRFVSGSTTYTSTQIEWTNNSVIGDYNMIQYKDLTYGTNGGNWVDAGHVAITATTFTITGLLPAARYEIRVVLVGSFYPSNSIFTTLPSAPAPFCSLTTPYTLTHTTCGDANGAVTIPNKAVYDIFYDFVLTDVQNNVHALTGLTADYYFLTATVKPFYQVIYGSNVCSFDWIAITATDSTMSSTSKSVRNSICGGFGNSTGRIVYVNSDTVTGSTYTCNLYEKKTHALIYSSTVTDINEVAFVPLDAGSYYLVIINNDNDCVLLIDNTQVKGETLSSVSGIKNLWITEWNSDVEYNYWSQSDEDYYVSSLDTNFFNSIKIKNFVDSTLPSVWYTINVETKSITYQQVMNKTKQGFVFTDKVELLISSADNDKWKELVDLLSQRYILVFKDNNNNYWCMGYLLGSTVKGYRLSVNQYGLSFESISNNKILTNISEDYVKASIL